MGLFDKVKDKFKDVEIEVVPPKKVVESEPVAVQQSDEEALRGFENEFNSNKKEKRISKPSTDAILKKIVKEDNISKNISETSSSINMIQLTNELKNLRDENQALRVSLTEEQNRVKVYEKVIEKLKIDMNKKNN